MLLFTVWNHERPRIYVELTLRLEYLDQYDYINLFTHLTVRSGVLKINIVITFFLDLNIVHCQCILHRSDLYFNSPLTV